MLDAAGSERAAVVVWSGGGPIGIELAARYPERVSALVLGDTYARLAAADDYPDGVAPEIIELFVRDNPDPDVQWSVGGSDDIDAVRTDAGEQRPVSGSGCSGRRVAARAPRVPGRT